MTAANYGFKDMLENFLCNLARLNIREYVIAALDEDIFRWAAVRGHAVFKFTHKSGMDGVGGSGVHKELTQLKSAAVREALLLGYSVFFFDPDVVLFKNPLYEIMDLQSMYVQSNAPYIENPANTVRVLGVEIRSENQNGFFRINSGCYFVPATKPAISAFTDIEKHARSSESSEQPSFYYVLCLPPLGSVHGTDTCEFNSTVGALQVKFLDRSAYAHGAVFLTPENRNVWNLNYSHGASAFTSQVALHNNWIKGYAPKIQRQKAANLWFLLPDGSCLW